MEQNTHRSETAEIHAEPGVWTRLDGSALPKVLDPVTTMEVVRRYVETERNRSRRILLWTSTLFLFIVFLVLVIFVSVGIYLLRNYKEVARKADEATAQTASYYVEVLGISNKINTVAVDIEQKTVKEDNLLKSEMERFGRWVATKKSSDTRTISLLEARLKDFSEEDEKRNAEFAELKARYDSLAESLKNMTNELGRFTKVRGGGLSSGAEAGLPESTDIEGEGATNQFARIESMIASMHSVSNRDLQISVVKFPNGDRYEGEIVNGLASGRGIYSYANGDRYEGEFRNDVKNGRGTFFFHNGDRYDGDFREDMIGGKGRMLYINGNKYVGDFRNGLRYGNGMLCFSNGDVYRGDFVNDSRTGKGIYIFTDGSKYVGEFMDGKRHGKGKYVFSSGEEYVGDFRNGKKDGEGTCVYPDGTRLSGLWKDDKLLRRTDESS